ncbi:MAG: protein kinase [Deltaproteobacteria bacterium]|nr:protein kinase [Deltaproteobacteria bacterium]
MSVGGADASGPGSTEVLGRFAVRSEVGRGAAGIVFDAQDRDSGARVALKILALPEADAEARHRFLDEGALLSSLDHPGIVRIFDFGTLGAEPLCLCGARFGPEAPYIAMEWLPGDNLQQRHARRPLSLIESIELGRQLASALTAAHAAGVIHRDVKPSNVFVLEPPAGAATGGAAGLQVKLVDFGVACTVEQSLTDASLMVGTPAYMAPEQARGDALIDRRCDLYSLGATLFELVAGRTPHTGTSTIAMLAKLVSTPAQRLSELGLDVPAPLDDLVDRMLQMERERRPEAVEVAARLAELGADPSLPELVSEIDRQLESVHSSASRLVTTLVALHAATGEGRAAELARLREGGAEAVALGRDSIVAFLGARRAHGTEAVRALEVGRHLAQLGAQVGVATGRALVDLTRPCGEVVDHASALARDAGAGELLADEATAQLSRGRFEFAAGPPGARRVGEPLPERRLATELAPFVGRDAELASLFEAFDRCLTQRSPVVASVSGPPGIGKSRLARELLRGIPGICDQLAGAAEAGPVRVAQARGEAYGRAMALGAAADVLCDLLRVPAGSSSRELGKVLAPLGLTHDEDGLLGKLLAGEPFGAEIDPQRARDTLYLAMTELVVRMAARGACVLVLEDAQWCDPESVAWFDHLLARATGCPLFAALLVRPSFWRDDPQRFAGRDHVRLELRPISRRATMRIARALIGEQAPAVQIDQVAQQAAGSPLFAEELARVIASGKPAGSVPTIEAAIQVSLDALDPAARDALVCMSVFGQSCWGQALAALDVLGPQLAFDRLAQADLVVELEQSRFAGTREYRFKHALVRDVAHASASEALLGDKHARAAAWLAEAGGDAATIAEHYDLGDKHALAAGYWEVAARRALATDSLRDALRMADRALTFAEEQRTSFARALLLDEIYSRLDERASERSDAIQAMADNAYDEASRIRTLGARARYDHARSAGTEVDERLAEVCHQSAELGLLDEEARCSATLATRHAYAGALGLAEAEAAHLLDLAQERGVPSAAVDAWQTLAVVRQTRGLLAAALEARRNAARAARAAGLRQREAMLTINLGFALTTIGARDEARAEIAAGIRMAEEVGSAGTVRLGRMILLGWAAHFGADPALDPALAEPRASADEAATGMWIVPDRVTLGVLFYRGWELLGGDQAQRGRARSLLKMSAEAYRSTGNRDVLPVALGLWAEAERRLGNVEQATELANEAAELVESGAPSLLGEAPIYLALHSAGVDRGDLAGARRAIERAMPLLLRRVDGLGGTTYAREFLTALPQNALLLGAADTYGCVPETIERIIAAS